MSRYIRFIWLLRFVFVLGLLQMLCAGQKTLVNRKALGESRGPDLRQAMQSPNPKFLDPDGDPDHHEKLITVGLTTTNLP